MKLRLVQLLKECKFFLHVSLNSYYNCSSYNSRYKINNNPFFTVGKYELKYSPQCKSGFKILFNPFFITFSLNYYKNIKHLKHLLIMVY